MQMIALNIHLFPYEFVLQSAPEQHKIDVSYRAFQIKKSSSLSQQGSVHSIGLRGFFWLRFSWLGMHVIVTRKLLYQVIPFYETK
jgi:hypothetical protein